MRGTAIVVAQEIIGCVDMVLVDQGPRQELGQFAQAVFEGAPRGKAKTIKRAADRAVRPFASDRVTCIARGRHRYAGRQEQYDFWRGWRRSLLHRPSPYDASLCWPKWVSPWIAAIATGSATATT